MELYLLENYREIFPDEKGRTLTDRLIVMALEEYGIRNPQIKRTEKGKPFISNYCLDETRKKYEGKTHFSVSHSGEIFVCLISDENVGIDIQHRRKIDEMKIASRYFDDGELEYVKNNGIEGFFKLWTRKEAYSKYTGRGLEDIMGKIQVLERNDVEFMDFQLEEGLYCSCCMKRR